MNINLNTIDRAATALNTTKGYVYTAGFLCTQLKAAIAMLPKTKQAQFLAALESAVGNVVMVERTNILSGQKVKIRWDQVGSINDPQMDVYHSA